MIRLLSLIFIGCFPFLSLFANGGPIDGGALASSGQIKLNTNAKIDLVKEDLAFRIDGDFVHVDVKYLFVNQGEAQKVWIGFSAMIDYGNEGYDYSAGPQAAFDDQLIMGFAILDGKDTLRDSLIFEGPDEPRYGDTIRAWRFFEIEFAEGESKTLSISYDASTFYSDWVTSKSFLPGFSDRVFGYDLSPAGYWGDGVVDTLNVTVDASSLGEKASKMKVSAPFFLKGQDGKLHGSYLNTDFTEAEPIKISYDASAWALSRYIEEHRIDYNLIADIHSSSELGSRYSPRMMFDGKLSTPWSEGVVGIGKGEWIEVEFTKPVNVGAVYIVNGLVKSKKLYDKNGKVLKLKIEELPSKKSAYGFEERVVELEVKDFEDPMNVPMSSLADQLLDLGEGRQISGFRFTIEDAVKGSIYEDICISEIYILGWYDE